jgi:RNA polymerase sigma-70 factor (ECF subfamily)
MYRVALNTAIMSLKKRSLYRLIRNNLKREGTILNYEEGDDYFEKWNLVRKEINHLSDIEKAIVHLYLEGYSYGEIAEILGYSAKCINVRMFRIKEKLKNRLQIDLREELC